jgi:glutamate formiminotransferase
MSAPTLLAVPNVSEGRRQESINTIADAFTSGAEHNTGLIDVHTDADHHRSVFTLAGHSGELSQSLLAGAQATVELVDIMGTGADSAQDRQHPHVGALDVVPIVYYTAERRGAACAEALVIADLIASQLQVPVFLYGELSATDTQPARSRAELRRGGVAGLSQRMADSQAPLKPDFGPARMHPSAGATLVAARPPLVAFNLQLSPPATLQDARAIAAAIRQGGTHGLPGVRAIGVLLDGHVAQVSMNIEQPFHVSLAEVVHAVRAHRQVAIAELVGLAPAAAFDGFPADVPIPGFDPARHLIENALGW